MNEAMPTIEASGLTKRFGKTTALEGLDLVLRSCLIGALTTPDNTDTAGGDIINSTIQLRPDAVVRAAWVGERRALGRRTCGEVSFLVSLPLADTATQVGVVLVVLTTPLTFAVGSGLLALAVRRSRRWVRAALVAAALLAVVSAAGRPPAGRRRPRERGAVGGDAPGHRRRVPGDRAEGGCPIGSVTENELTVFIMFVLAALITPTPEPF